MYLLNSCSVHSDVYIPGRSSQQVPSVGAYGSFLLSRKRQFRTPVQMAAVSLVQILTLCRHFCHFPLHPNTISKLPCYFACLLPSELLQSRHEISELGRSALPAGRKRGQDTFARIQNQM